MKKITTYLKTTQFKPIKNLSILLLLLLLIRYGSLYDRISHINHSTTILNILLLTTLLLILLTYFYLLKKTNHTQTTIDTSQQIPCAPLILSIGGLFISFLSILLIIAVPHLGILYLIMGLIAVIESLTTKLTLTNDGILITYHKIFPFPAIYYPKDTIQNIKTYSNILSIKHTQKFLAPKLYVLINKKQFTKHLKTTTLQNLKP
jgi:hypothetical protein